MIAVFNLVSQIIVSARRNREILEDNLGKILETILADIAGDNSDNIEDTGDIPTGISSDLELIN